MHTKSYATVASDIEIDPYTELREIRVGGAGHLHIENWDGTEDTIQDILANTLLAYISPKTIFASGTTATKLTLFYGAK